MSDERKTVWGWSTTEHGERYDGACDSREEAIDEARLNVEPGEPFYVLEGVFPDAAEAMPDADRIIEWMGEHAHDNWNDRDGGWPSVTHEAAVELEELLAAWARKHIKVTFWIGVGEPERIDGAQEDNAPST